MPVDIPDVFTPTEAFMISSRRRKGYIIAIYTSLVKEGFTDPHPIFKGFGKCRPTMYLEGAKLETFGT
jgi:hypothetical protein